MGKIIVLDENTSNKIAAGEVIERPASVIKELVENSIDAGASSITVEIKNGGISYIRVTDNGSGIDEDDVEIAFERHATSKIKSANDLDSISTLGFRGEALASIAAVSRVELSSRVQKNAHGMYISIQGGNVKESKPVGCPVGTTFIIRDLFYNTPARFKFLKKDSTETGYISDIISRIALAKPHISFKLISNNATIIHTPGNNELLSAVFSIYGKETAKEVAEISYQDNKVRITGYAGKPEISRATRNHQSVFVNGRYVKSKLITSAIDEAYKTFLMKNKFAFIVMNLEVNPLIVDVNVHPTKMEIRFSEEQEIFRSVYHSINNALLGKVTAKTAHFEEKDNNISYKFENKPAYKENYIQQNFSTGFQYIKEKPETFTRKNTFSTSTLNNYTNSAKRDEINVSREIRKESLPEKPVEEKKSLHTYTDIVSPVRKENNEQTAKNENTTQKSSIAEINTILNEISEDSRELKNQNEHTETSLEQKCQNVQELKNEFLVNSKIIGQAFSTYILLQHENELLMIDQHAAHERIMYERLRTKFINNESMSQELISPVVIELANHEIKFLEEEQEFLQRLGFNYESFGNNTIMLRSIPYLDNGGSIKEIFTEILDYVIGAVKNGYKKDSFSSIADEAIYTLACKSAVKANKKLDDMEIQSIINELTKLENPFTCPHGRPTIVRLRKYELEKMFKRIV